MNMNGVLIGTADPDGLKAYYTKLFGTPTCDDQGYFGWQIGSGSVTLDFTTR